MRLDRWLVAGWAALVLLNFPVATTAPGGSVPRWSAFTRPAGAPAPGSLGASGSVVRRLAAGWADHGRGAGWALLLLAAAAGLGGPAAGWLGAGGLRAPGLRPALGLLAGGLGLFGLGLAGLLAPGFVRLVLVLPALAGARRLAWRPALRAPGWLAGCEVLTAGAWTLGMFNPDPGVDALCYHLRLPFYYALRHRVFPVWHQIHAHVPQLWEIGLAVVPPARMAVVAQVLSAACIWPVRGLVLAAGGGTTGARIAALLLVSSPLVVGVGTSAYSDLPLMWLGALAFALFAAGGGGQGRRTVAGGAVLAAACAVKYAAFPLVAGCAAWLAADAARRRSPRTVLLAAAGWSVAFWPWLAWNGLAAGNPFAPFLAGLFPGALPPLPFAARLSGAVFHRPVLDVLASPWTGYVTCEPFLFISPWLVAASPAVLRGRDIPAGGRAMLLAAGVAWGGLIADERFLLGAMPAAAGWLGRALPLPALAAAAFFGLNLAGIARQVFLPPARLAVAAGLLPQAAWDRAALAPAPDYVDAAAWLNASVTPRERILIVSDDKSHLIRRECIHDHVMDYPTRLVWILENATATPARIAVRFRQLGIRWVLSLPDRSAARLRAMPDLFPLTPPQARGWAGFWETRAIPAWRADHASIWRIADTPHAAAETSELPVVQEIMSLSAEAAWRREGPPAAIAELRRYAAAYPRVGAVHRLLGRALLAFHPGASARAEALRHLAIATRTGLRPAATP